VNRGCGLLLLLVAAGVPVSLAAKSPRDGQAIFEKKCQTCHALPDPSVEPEGGWEAKMKQMSVFAQLKPDQKAAVLDFLKSHQRMSTADAVAADDEKLIQDKCGRCHAATRVFIEHPSAETWEHVVTRMREFEPDWISEEEANRIVRFLTEFKQAPKPPPAADESSLFATRCSACHTLERVFKRLSESDQPIDWEHLVARMREKAPEWLTEEETERIYEYLERLREKG